MQCSYLQSQSWLRSICDLQPWPQELAVISPEGLPLPVAFLILHISKQSPIASQQHIMLSSKCSAQRLDCLLLMQWRKCRDVLPLGLRVIYSLLSSVARGCNHSTILLHLLSVSQLIRGGAALISLIICHRAVRQQLNGDGFVKGSW